MTSQELKIVISRGTFRGVPLWFFMVMLTLTLLTIALVLTRDSNKNKIQEKSKSPVKIFQISIMIIAVWLAIFIKLSSHVDLFNSSTGERIMAGTYWEVKKVRKEILLRFKERERKAKEEAELRKPLSTTEKRFSGRIVEILAEAKREEKEKTKKLNKEEKQ